MVDFANRKLSSMVLNESVMTYCDKIAEVNGVQEAWRILHILTDYGLYGIEPPADDKSLWIYNLDTELYLIKLSRDKYNKSVEDGKRGGRKKIETNDDEIASMLESGYTYQQISERMNVSISTLKRRMAAKRKTEGQNSNNLSDTQQSVKMSKGSERVAEGFAKVPYHNVNVNVNGNANENANLFTGFAGNDPLEGQKERTPNLNSQLQNKTSLQPVSIERSDDDDDFDTMDWTIRD